MLLPPCTGLCTQLCLSCMNHRIKRALDVQPAIPLRGPEQNWDLPRSPHAGPTVLQSIWPKLPRPPVPGAGGAGPAPWKNEERGSPVQTPPALRHSEASQTISTNHLLAQMGTEAQSRGSTRLGSWSRSEVELSLGSRPLTLRPQSWAASLTLWTGRRAQSNLEEELRANTSDGFRIRTPLEPVWKDDENYGTRGSIVGLKLYRESWTHGHDLRGHAPVCQRAQNSGTVGISRADKVQEALKALHHSCPMGVGVTANTDLTSYSPCLTQGQGSWSGEACSCG